MEKRKLIDMPEEFEEEFNKAALAGDEELAKKYTSLVLIGQTGHGKSSTGN